MRSRPPLALFVVALALASCRRTPALSPAPARRTASVAELSIYRLLAESTYVRSTGRPVAVVAVSLDSACERAECPPLAQRWGIESPWWAPSADTQRARSANAALLRHAADTVDLHAIGDGHDQLLPIETREIPVAWSDESMWGEFQYYHRGAAGLLRFSPIGFTPSGREAVVVMQWECGPACGHTVVSALRRDSTSEWRIADMLLLSSRQATAAIRAE